MEVGAYASLTARADVFPFGPHTLAYEVHTTRSLSRNAQGIGRMILAASTNAARIDVARCGRLDQVGEGRLRAQPAHYRQGRSTRGARKLRYCPQPD
jgi:hypothetical protein